MDIYCDGGTGTPIPSPNGIYYSIVIGDEKIVDCAVNERYSTSNQAELLAIIHALKLIYANGYKFVNLYSDSSYAVNRLTKKIRYSNGVYNEQLIRQARGLLWICRRDGLTVNIEWQPRAVIKQKIGH